jgi:hypothetical protein
MSFIVAKEAARPQRKRLFHGRASVPRARVQKERKERF